jgi:hypothetical protein
MRFDDLVRSERYFTATLLPAVLFHDSRKGVRRFVELVDARANTECDRFGNRGPKGTPDYDFHDVEVITEFHIKRDLKFADKFGEDANGESGEDDERERQDAPDVVIVAGQELVVCEGKFFSELSRRDLNKQLCSQRRQVQLLFHSRKPDQYVHTVTWPSCRSSRSLTLMRMRCSRGMTSERWLRNPWGATTM